MTIVTIGIDLAKNVFAVHCVDATGKPVLLRPSVPRAKLAELIASFPPCLIGMEACSGAHHWARLLRPLLTSCARPDNKNRVVMLPHSPVSAMRMQWLGSTCSVDGWPIGATRQNCLNSYLFNSN